MKKATALALAGIAALALAGPAAAKPTAPPRHPSPPRRARRVAFRD